MRRHSPQWMVHPPLTYIYIHHRGRSHEQINRSFLEAAATMVVFGENYIHELMIRRKAQCSLQWKAAGTEFSEKTEAEFRLFLTIFNFSGCSRLPTQATNSKVRPGKRFWFICQRSCILTERTSDLECIRVWWFAVVVVWFCTGGAL